MADPNPLAGMPLAESLASNMNESLQWMSRMWGSAAAGASPSPLASGLPSMMMPTLDPKELDKRINDLRSVQNWLDMNRALLHTTIQTLEMQRNAIVALQSMATAAQGGPGASLRSSQTARAGADASASGGGPGAAPALPFNPAQWWTALNEQFARVASAAVAEAAGSETPPDPDAPPPRAADRPRNTGEPPAAAGAGPGRKGPGQ